MADKWEIFTASDGENAIRLCTQDDFDYIKAQARLDRMKDRLRNEGWINTNNSCWEKLTDIIYLPLYPDGHDYDVLMAQAIVVADHTYGPNNYLAWHDWADKKSKTHDQEKCDECGLWSIWTPKKTEDQAS